MIDFKKLNDSIPYYMSWGYQRIEVPWTVSKQISDITRPPNAKDFKIEGKDKVLVASGEQSFLYLFNKGFLPRGTYQAITPCFRDEPFTSLHTKYFIKNELITTEIIDLDSVVGMVETALEFFQKYLPDAEVVKFSDEMYDIVYKGDELGSYGIRRCDFLEYVYGTGLAEPRLTRIMKKYGISH
jgi:hypothetical protein